MDKAFVLVGHGAGDEALELYNGLLEAVREKEKNTFLVMLHGEPDAARVAKEIKDMGIKGIVLIPLLLAPGHHMEKNIVSKDSSIQKAFIDIGMEVEVRAKTLLEYETVFEAISNSVLE
nr:sirohydrochlorin cobaltochelatase [uncultured Butyrivibrio sp.]